MASLEGFLEDILTFPDIISSTGDAKNDHNNINDRQSFYLKSEIAHASISKPEKEASSMSTPSLEASVFLVRSSTKSVWRSRNYHHREAVGLGGENDAAFAAGITHGRGGDSGVDKRDVSSEEGGSDKERGEKEEEAVEVS